MDNTAAHFDSQIGVPAELQRRLTREHSAQMHRFTRSDEASIGGGSCVSSRTPTKDAQPLQIETHLATLAVEAAVALVINGIHYAVLMASPAQLEHLALGFLYSEGLIQHSGELLDWEITAIKSVEDLQAFAPANESRLIESQAAVNWAHLLSDYEAYVVTLVLNQRCHQRILAQRRQLAGRTGCGMCGMTGLQQALPDLSAYSRYATSDEASSSPNYPVQPVSVEQAAYGRGDNAINGRADNGSPNSSADKQTRPNLEQLLQIRALIESTQATHQLTGAVHAAATWYQGELYLFEDVGRHNALDKLIGWQLRNQVALEFVVMTSRLSIELVQKAVRCRLPWLVGMSAPTSTAVRVAQRYGLGLAGFLRDNRVTYYGDNV